MCLLIFLLLFDIIESLKRSLSYAITRHERSALLLCPDSSTFDFGLRDFRLIVALLVWSSELRALKVSPRLLSSGHRIIHESLQVPRVYCVFCLQVFAHPLSDLSPSDHLNAALTCKFLAQAVSTS